MRSDCCNAPVRVAGRTTQHYVCTACGKACGAGKDIKRIVPAVGDKHQHPTGAYEVDWVYDDGGKMCVGLCGESMTWTGTVAELQDAGFQRQNATHDGRRIRRTVDGIVGQGD